MFYTVKCRPEDDAKDIDESSNAEGHVDNSIKLSGLMVRNSIKKHKINCAYN